MKTLELENLGITELSLTETLFIEGGDANGTMTGGDISLEWTRPIINFAAGLFSGIFG